MDVTTTTPAARSNGRLAGWLALVGSLAALNYWSRYGLEGETVDEPLYRWSTFAGALVQFGLMLGLTLWIVAGGPARELLALRPPRDWGKAAWIGLGAVVATFVVSGIVNAAGLSPGEEQGLTPDGWDPDRAAPFVANFLVAAAFVPFVEELLFRGAGFSLLARFGPATAVLGTGLLFALGHGLIEALPILLVFGVGLAILRHVSDSVYPAVIVHALFNALSLIVSVAAGGSA